MQTKQNFLKSAYAIGQVKQVECLESGEERIIANSAQLVVREFDMTIFLEGSPLEIRENLRDFPSLKMGKDCCKNCVEWESEDKYITYRWEDFLSVQWNAENNRIVFRFIDYSIPVLVLNITNNKSSVDAAQILRERVQNSIVHTVSGMSALGANIWAVIRRGENGLYSQVISDYPLDSSSETLRLVQILEHRAREAVGIEN